MLMFQLAFLPHAYYERWLMQSWQIIGSRKLKTYNTLLSAAALLLSHFYISVGQCVSRTLKAFRYNALCCPKNVTVCPFNGKFCISRLLLAAIFLFINVQYLYHFVSEHYSWKYFTKSGEKNIFDSTSYDINSENTSKVFQKQFCLSYFYTFCMVLSGPLVGTNLKD